MIELTIECKAKVADLLAEENNPKLNLRTFVQGGGCSGMEYGFTFDEEINEDDFQIPLDDGHFILVDAMSMQYLHGATFVYQVELQGGRFIFDNPHAQSTCGCGSSFNTG
jgi:iron-sulfur cluster insertion protein